MKIRLTLPFALNSDTDIGIVNTANSIFVENRLVFINNIFNISKEKYVLFVKRPFGFAVSNFPSDLWAYPVNIPSVKGVDYKYSNINDMVVNSYNDIVRVIKLNIKEDNYLYNVLYIDPQSGYYDILEDETDIMTYQFLPASDIVNNCIDSIPISPEGQIIKFTTDKDTKIYGFYQLSNDIVVFSNKGIYQLKLINGTNFFEPNKIEFVGDFDVVSIKRTWGTETIIWFVYENELYILSQNNLYGKVEVKKIGGKNILKNITLDENFCLFGITDKCAITSPLNKKTVFFDVTHKFSGVTYCSVGGIDSNTFIIREYNIPDCIMEVRNEVNDTRLKILRQIILYGINGANYLKAEVYTDINPNYKRWKSYFFNIDGVANCNHVFTSLNFKITGEINQTDVCFTGIDIIFEYVDNKVKYDREFVMSKGNNNA